LAHLANNKRSLGSTVLNVILFADDQIIFSESEYDLQTAVHQLQVITNSYNLEILTKKTKVVAFEGKHPVS
jgi:hypothetical protein